MGGRPNGELKVLSALCLLLTACATPTVDRLMPAAAPVDAAPPLDLGTAPGVSCSKDRYCFRNPLPQGNGINGVYVGSSGEIVTVGDRGTIMRYSAGRWTQEVSGTQGLLNAVWGPSAQDLWVVGGNGLILRNSGGSWSQQPSGTTFLLNGIHGTSASNLWAVGVGGLVLRWNGTRDRKSVV